MPASGTDTSATTAPLELEFGANTTAADLRHAQRLGSFQTAAPVPPPEPLPAAPIPVGTPERVRVPSVGIDLPISRGGQATIDQGRATWFDDGPGGWPDPTPPGVVGTFWLAGHRTSAGGPFARVVDIAIGATVHISMTDGSVASYRITTSSTVTPDNGWTAVYGTDPTQIAIAIQTSLPGNLRLILRGEII